MSITIPYDFEDTFKNDIPIVVQKDPYRLSKTSTSINTMPSGPQITINPLNNSDVKFANIEPLELVQHDDTPIETPNIFDWRHAYISDTEHIKNIKNSDTNTTITTNKDSRVVFVDGKNTNITDLVKKHIYTIGPILGSFLVFENFISGNFTKKNGGVYMERGVYDTEMPGVVFSDDEVNSTRYIGPHIVSVVGWGVATNILVDNKGKRDNVPYWYVRNSWTQYWGDGGYFKIAMYPWNKLSQLDKQITIESPFGYSNIGGMVIDLVKKKEEQLEICKQSSTVVMVVVTFFIIVAIGFITYFYLKKMKHK
jgi:hypothetical protein